SSAGDQSSELPLASAFREWNPDAARQPRLRGREADRALPREPAETHVWFAAYSDAGRGASPLFAEMPEVAIASTTRAMCSCAISICRAVSHVAIVTLLRSPWTRRTMATIQRSTAA